MKKFEIFHDSLFSADEINITREKGLKQYSEETQKLIDKGWETALGEGLDLWDGKVTGFIDSELKDGILTVNTITTTYKSYIGTNIRNLRKIPDNNQRANCIAACCVVETSDNKLIIGMRSHKVAESRGIWHFCGGNMEPHHKSPFETIRAELLEELNVEEKDIDKLVCTGMGRSFSNMKPEFLFYCKLNSTENKFNEKMKKAVEYHEHSEVRFIPVNKFKEFTTSHNIADIGTACAHQYFRHIERLNK